MDNNPHIELPDAAKLDAVANDPDLILSTSLWQDAWKRLRKNRMSLVCGYIVLGIIALCVVGPWILSFFGYSYETQNLEYGAHPPSAKHWFGTDFFGRDSFTRVLYGGRVSLLVGFLAATVSATVGTLYGAISGYAGGRIDAVMMRIVDILYALPYMMTVIIFVTIFGRNFLLIFVALGLVSWLTTARIVRGQVLSLKQQEFVQAAKSVGASDMSIILRHLIPNTLGPIIIYFTLTVPSMILQEAFLSFLGLGVQEPMPSLGALINDGAAQMTVFWWQLIFPGCFLALLLFSLNFLGDGLRDALDPKMK